MRSINPARGYAHASTIWAGLVCFLFMSGAIAPLRPADAHMSSLRGIWFQRVTYEAPGPSGVPSAPPITRPIRAVYTLWYAGEAEWRLSGRYLDAPVASFYREHGSLATPFLPFPGRVIRDGATITYYNASGAVVDRRIARSDGSNPMGGIAAPYLTRLDNNSLASIVERLRKCRTVVMHAGTVIARRPTVQLRLGPERCPRVSSDSALFMGRESVWLDARTLVVMRDVLYFPGSGRKILLSNTTRSISYNTPPK